MLKIYNNFNNRQVFQSISHGFLDYVPGAKFREVLDIAEADIIFMKGVIDPSGVFSVEVSSTGVSLRNLRELSDFYSVLDAKHRMIWVDAMGPSVNRDASLFDPETTGLRETDILISPGTIPPRPNTFRDVSHIEKFVFRHRNRFERVPGSVVISSENVLNRGEPEKETPMMIANLMGFISRLIVTNVHSPDSLMTAAFAKYASKVSYENLSYPQGVVYHLSQAEFVLHTHTRLGIEMMGVEGGMCGCQPVYPDTEFYRDIFDGTGVEFFDTQNPVESLRSILKAGSKFDKKTTEAFRTKFSAEDTLPGFWEKVYEVYAGT